MDKILWFTSWIYFKLFKARKVRKRAEEEMRADIKRILNLEV